MTDNDIAAWASAYIEAQKDPDLLNEEHPLWWAVQKFMGEASSTSSSPQDCWATILEILSRTRPDNVIGILAAGPLEDLIQYHGQEFIERIEAEARRNQEFRRLLGGVWRSCTPEIWARIEKARRKLW